MSGIDSSDDENNHSQIQYKIVILGDGAVGKTSMCKKFVENHFADSYKQTVGLDFFVKRIEIKNKDKTYQIALQIWDIGGQSVGSKMLKKYIHGSDGILLAYDITNYTTFEDLSDWLEIVHSTFPKLKETNKPKIGLVGNKYDLQHIASVKSQKHKEFVDKNGMLSYYVSAKTGDGLDSLFYHFASSLTNINMSRNEIESHTKVITANVISHPKNDKNDPNLKSVSQIINNKNKKDCTIL